MAEKESAGSCLAEIYEVEEKDTPSGRSTRTSVAKLPKIGIFSSSAKSINNASSTEFIQAQSDDATKLPSKPTSRPGTDKASTVSTQQLEIRINLSNIIDPTQAMTMKPEEPKKEDSGKDGSKVSTRPAQELPSNGPPIWECGNSIKNKDKRPRARTTTWPALQYKLWLDSSNLPLHLLSNDERANRPLNHLSYLQKTRKIQKLSRPASSNNSFKPIFSDGNSDKDWSGKFLSVSRPPFHPDMKSNDSSLPNHKTEKERKTVETAAINGLRVGVGDSWQVASSYTTRRESHHGSGHGQIQKPTSGRLKSILGANLPQENQTTKVLYPRIPSRMGPNNLEAFLKQNTSFGGMSHSGESIPGPRPNSSSSKLAAAHAAMISPRHFCNTSAEVSLLSLRSFARNPRMLHELAEKSTNRRSNLPMVHHNAHTKSVKLTRDGVRHVRFEVPCGNEDDDIKLALVKSKNDNIMMKQTLSDVTPPQTPPTFDCAFRISVVPHF